MKLKRFSLSITTLPIYYVPISLLIVSLFSQSAFAGPMVNDTITVSGEFNGWPDNDNMIYGGEASAATDFPNYKIWYLTSQITYDTQDEFKFENWGWGNQWLATAGGDGSADAVSLNTVYTVYWDNSDPRDNMSMQSMTANWYYTFRIYDTGYANSSAAILATSAGPVSISTVQSVSDTTSNNNVEVMITLSAAKCAQENLFLVYTVDDWTTRKVAVATFVSGSTYKATIPGFTSGTKVVYYVITTTVSASTYEGYSSDIERTLVTLSGKNNGGSNYSYKITPPAKTFHTIYPPRGVDGLGGKAYSDSELVRDSAGARAYLTWDTNYFYVGFAGGTTDDDKYNILVDTNPGTGMGSTTNFSGRSGWDTWHAPDIAYQALTSAVTRYWGSSSGWGGATDVTTSCTTYFGYNTGGTEDTIIVGIPRSHFPANTRTDSIAFWIYASSNADVMWANFDNTTNGMDFFMSDSQMVVNDSTVPSTPVLAQVYPSRSATDSFTISWTASSDPSGIAGYYYKISSTPTADTDGTFTRTTSVSGVSAGGAVGSDSVYVWAMDRCMNLNYTNRDQSSDTLETLNLFAEPVVINEIFAIDHASLGSSDSFSFIELYNSSASSKDIGNWTITDYTTNLPIPGGTIIGTQNFLVYHVKRGINYTDSYGVVHIFSTSDTTIKPGTQANLNSYGLYRSSVKDSTTINDFVCISTSSSGSTNDDSDAVAYGIWTNDSIATVGSFTGASIVRRYIDGIDNDTPGNWYAGTSPTWSPGFTNGAGNRTTVAQIGSETLALKQSDYSTDTYIASTGDTIFLDLSVTTSPGDTYIDNIPVKIFSSNDTIVVVLRENSPAAKRFHGYFKIVSTTNKRDNELYVVPPDIVYCTTVVGGALQLAGTDAADSLTVIASPTAPTASPIKVVRQFDGVDTLALLGGDTVQIHTTFDDVNGADEIQKGNLFVALIRTTSDSIVLKSISGLTSIDFGSDTIQSSISLDSSVSGTNLLCTWTLTFKWNWVSPGAYTLSARAVDSTGLESSWTDSTGNFYFINALAFSGTLSGSGTWNGAVSAGKYLRGSETVTWSGLNVVYSGSNLAPADNNYFDIRSVDDDGAIQDQTSGTSLNIARTVSAVNDLTEADTFYLINLPASASFADTRTSPVFAVDATSPVITFNRDSYTFKAPSMDSYGSIINIDFSDADQHIDTAYVWIEADTQIITSYGGASYTTNWALSSSLYNSLGAGPTQLWVEAVDSVGNKTTGSFYASKQIITIDGDLSDWQADEDIGTRGGKTFYLTWDDTFVFIGYDQQDLDDNENNPGNVGDNGDLFVFFNFNGATEGTPTPPAWNGMEAHTLPRPFQWVFALEGNTPVPKYDNLRKYTGGAWASDQESDIQTYWDVYAGWNTTPITEAKIAWTEFDLSGQPDTMDVVLVRFSEGDSRIWQSFPVLNPAPGDSYFIQTFTDYYSYKLVRDTVAPDSLALANLTMAVSPSTVEPGESFTIRISAVNSLGETIPGLFSKLYLGVNNGSLSISSLSLVNGVATISDSITGAYGNVTLTCSSVYNTSYTAQQSIFVNANIIDAWHKPNLNEPDTSVDADSFMRTFHRDGVDTLNPRRRQVDNPGFFWLGKGVSDSIFYTSVTMYYKTVGGSWTAITPTETVVIQSDSKTYYRFILNQEDTTEWDYLDTVSYYFRLVQTEKETTFIYGTGVADAYDSQTTIGEGTAQTSPFVYRIRSITPVAPLSAINPTDGQTTVESRRPSITWSEAGDSDLADGDTIVSYWFEIATDVGMSDTTSFSSDVGWQANGSVTHNCTTTLNPYQWYYWRVRAKDSEGQVSPYSSVFSFKINAIIAVDGDLSDWNSNEFFPALNAYGWYITWDSNYVYCAWKRNNAFEDSDLIQVYIDNEDLGVGNNTTVNFNGGGTHTLPFNADTCVYYEHQYLSGGLHYQWSNGGAWNYVASTGGSEYKNTTDYQLEFSFPWSIIGNPSKFKVMISVVNKNNSNYMWSSCPTTNEYGAAGKDFATYLEFPKLLGVAPNSKQYYKSKRTWRNPSPSPISFSPNIDGVKDFDWGSTPSDSSPQYDEHPAPGEGSDSQVAVVPIGGICRDVYVTNDAQWLYIGWQAFGDPFALDEPNESEQSAHYGFVITDTSSWGSPWDPWKNSMSATRVDGYGCNVWTNLFATYGNTNFAGGNRYVSDGASWDIGTDLTDKDYSAYLNDYGSGWGEVRIPLSSIRSGMQAGDTIALIHYGRHNGYKNGIDDCTPFDTDATYPYADVAYPLQFRDTRVIVYLIKQGVISAYHLPESTPVTGYGKMRSPSQPKYVNKVHLMAGVTPVGVASSATLYYSNNAKASWSSVTVTEEFQSGGYSYWSCDLPNLPKDSQVFYYFKFNSDQMTTYLYGSDTYSTATSSEASAQTNAFYFQISNSAPTSPTTITLSSNSPNDNDTITATASGALDSDATDILTYRFEWKKNAVSQFVAYDSTAPYTSSVPPESTTQGETWQVYVSAGDGIETSSATTGPVAAVSTLATWPGSAPSLVNRAHVVTTNGITEWIWKDKFGEVVPSNLDLKEARVQADTDYIYFYFALGSFTEWSINIAVAIDTTLDSSGGNEIGDQTTTFLDSEISTPPLKHERQIIFHSTSTGGAMTAELDTGGAGGNNWIVPPSGVSMSVKASAGIIEARIARQDLQLKGTCNFRIATAIFQNVPGQASTTNTTGNYSPCDAFDAVTMAKANFNDSSWYGTSLQEDLSDGDIDFWVQLALTDTSLELNSTPTPTPAQIPGNGDTSLVNPPTFTWEIPSDTDANDTVVAYIFELADSGTSLDGAVTYRQTVIGNSFLLPGLLNDSAYYTWRAKPIDRAGHVGYSVPQSFFLAESKTILVSAPTDLENISNMRQMNGNEVAGTTIVWNWVAAVHSESSPIDSYIIEIDTSTSFTSPLKVDTRSSSTRKYTYTSALRGYTYYARIKAVDTGGYIGTSPASDGIYVSRRQVNGDSSDWASSGGYGLRTANLDTTLSEAIWVDSQGDQRTDVANSTSRDLLQFHVTADKYNLYFLIPTAALSSGECIGQIAVSFDASSDIRAFQGTGTYSEDSFTALDAAWEKLVRWRTGNDDCYILNTAYAGQPGWYTENSSSKYVELCAPLELFGGSAKVLGQRLKFTVATFVNSSGSVGQNGAGNSNTVDALSNQVTTWTDEVSSSDQVINAYLTVDIDNEGRATNCQLDTEVSPAPQLPNQNGAPFSSNRDYIMYNVFVDRFVSGRSDNVPGDPYMSGGDLKGLQDSITYFNELGITGLYTSPVLDFGGGCWGYNQSDFYRVQWSYTNPSSQYNGFDDLLNLAKTCRYHNMRLIVDWVPGQIYSGRTYTNHPDMFLGKRFGGERVLESSVEARQFMADHSLFMSSFGVYGLRADNTKFYDPGDEPTRGLPFYRYMRVKWDEVFPEIYVFGEMPGSSADIGMYTKDNNRIQGQLDFPIRSDLLFGWGSANQTAATFSGNFQGYENDYGSEAVMATLVENHDHSRAYNQLGGGQDNDGSKQSAYVDMLRAIFAFASVHSQNPVLFYGDEIPLSGWHSWTYPYPGEYVKSTERFGNTRKIVFDDASSSWLRPSIQKWFRARNIFSEIRASKAYRNLSTPDNYILVYRRGDGNGDLHKFIPILNNYESNINADISTGEAAGIEYLDWLHPEWGIITDAGGKVNWTTNARDGSLLVKGGYGRRTVHVYVGQADAIVSIDNYSAWTRKTDATGYCSIEDVVGWGGGGPNYDRTLYVWKQGYTVHSKTISLTSGDGNLAQLEETQTLSTTDNNPPPAPTGLAAVVRDRAAFLRWSGVTDYSNEDPQNVITYKIYRSQIHNDPSSQMIIEVMQSWYYDNNLDNFLTNDDTYYYRVRAVDRNGNLSGYSNEAMVVPKKYRVKFYFDLEGVWDDINSVQSVKIAGNSTSNLGNWAPISMTRIDTTMWYYECEMDPTSMPEFKYVVNNGDDNWEYNNVFSNIFYSTDNPRLVKIVDHTGDGTTIFTHRWNIDGDVAPRKPINAVATGGDTSIKIGWTPNIEPDVIRYIIRRSTDQSNWTEIGDASKTQNLFTDTGAVPATTYYYQVKAVDWWNNGGNWSATTSALLTSNDVTSPSKPTGLTLYPVDTSTIKLTWNPNSDGDLAGYIIYRSQDPSVPMTLENRVNAFLVSPTLSPYYTDSTVTNGIKYYYKICAQDQVRNISTPSDTQSAYIVAVTFSIDLANVNPSSMEISGSAYSMGPSPTRVALTHTASTVWSKTIAVFGGVALTYRYSYNNGSATENAFATSSTLREYTPPEVDSVTLNQDWNNAPAGVTNPQGYSGNQTAYLSWTSDSSVDVIGYTVKRASSADTNFVTITSSILSNTAYTDTGLNNGDTYYYYIYSVDGGAIQLQSSASRMVSVTPQLPVWIRFRVDAIDKIRSDIAKGREQ